MGSEEFAMAVDNSVVQAEAQAAINQTSGVYTLHEARALGVIISKRQWNNGQLDNDSLAAADHYLNMRMITSFNLELYPMGASMIVGYDLLKASLALLPDEVKEILQESKSPLTAPTPEIRAWAWRGLNDGAKDWPGMFRGGDITIPSAP
jgi:hypothetical protein